MRNKIKRKKAMATFEVIGYAVLAIVVILVAILIFTRVAGGGGKTIDLFGNKTQTSADKCITDPSNCKALGPAIPEISSDDAARMMFNVNIISEM